MSRTRLLSVLLLVLAAAGPISLYAQDANSAKAFLMDAYTHYGKNGKGIDFMGPKANRYFHSSLIALIRADDKANGPGNVGALDGDPLCGCQDWDGIFDLKIDIQLQSPGRALAEVSFALDDAKSRNSDSWRKLRIQLRTERGEWRIYDILDVSQPHAPFDARDALIKDNQNIKQTSKSKTVQP